MSNPTFRTLSLACCMALAGCATLQPSVPNADTATPAAWPVSQSISSTDDLPATAESISWDDLFNAPDLQAAIELALIHNRDLRVAILNVERAQSLYRVRRADRVPSIGISGSATRTGGDGFSTIPDIYEVGVGIAEFELDLFGRVRNLSDAALESYLATDEAQHDARLALITEVTIAWLTLAADQQLLTIAEATVENYDAAYELAKQRKELGAVSGLDVSQARTLLESARSDLAQFSGRVAQGRNALMLLTGNQIDPSTLPVSLNSAPLTQPTMPEGVPSEVLLRRPDVRAAEHRLRSASANIGAARAAFFPSISLTGSVGKSSNALDDLFSSGNSGWRFVPRINIPIFQGGRLRAALGVAEADQDIALAQYEGAIQSAFRDVADALALSATLADQRVAQESLVEASLRTLELSKARYDAGQDSYLLLLDAQRTSYAAKQALVTTQRAERINRARLFRALGGSWPDQTP